MVVLHINSYYNGCPFYRHLYDAQAAAGLKLRVFVPMPRGDAGAGADYGDCADVSENHGRFDRALFPVKHSKILRDAMARYGGGGFDVIHAHSLFSNGYIAMKLGAHLNVPYIVAVRDSDVNVFFAKMPHMRALGRRILAGAARVVFLSESYRDGALAPYLSDEQFQAVREKSVVIPNGIAPFWHEHAGAAHSLRADGLRLMTVGRASKRKNIGAALRAAQLLVDSGMNVQFDVVIGVVEDEHVLRALAEPPFVRLHRNLSREQLLPLYREADVFVLPSLTETFGLVYAEAMSQGLPVLYTRAQGFDGQFPDGEVGFAIDPNSPQDIADAVVRTLSDYRAISENCVRLAAGYDWTRFAAQYINIYREALNIR